MVGAVVRDEVVEIRSYELVLHGNGARAGSVQAEDPSAQWFLKEPVKS